MKAVIIENEYDVDNSIKAFLKDNPNLFESVKEMTFAQSRGKESILEEVLKADTIIVASTWMYKDQVEEYLDAFLNEKFPVKTLYIHSLVDKLNEWKLPGWRGEPEIFEKVKAVFKKGFPIIDFRENPSGPHDIMDGLNKLQSMFISEEEQTTYGRAKMVCFPVKYSEEHDLFYLEHDYYNLESQIEDEQKNLRN